MLKKQIINVILLVLAVVVSISVLSLNAYGIEYINEQWGIKFDYPYQFNLSSSSTDAGECINENQCLLVFKKEGNPEGFVTLLIQRGLQFQERCQCDSTVEFAQYEYKQMFEWKDGFSLINDNQTTLDDNVSATQMEYEITKNTDISRHIVIWTTVNGTFYTINYHNSNEDFPVLLPDFKGFLESIEFSETFEKIQPIQTKQEKKKPSFLMSTSTDDTIVSSKKVENKDKLQNESAASRSTNILNDNTVSNEIASSKPSITDTPKNEISDYNFDLFFVNPGSYLFKNAIITGKIFNIIPSSANTGGIQIYHLGNNDRDIIISYSLDKINTIFREEECVKIEGYAGPVQEYRNLFGGYRTSPVIYADSIQKINCFDMTDPNAKLITMEHMMEKGGIKVTLHKAEFDDKNTRVFLTVENTNTEEDETVRFYDTSNSLAFQGKKQYEAQYSSSYPDISSSIPPGIEESGVVVFEPMQYGIPTKFQFEMGIGIDDYKFVFNTDVIGTMNLSEGDSPFDEVQSKDNDDEEETKNNEDNDDEDNDDEDNDDEDNDDEDNDDEED